MIAHMHATLSVAIPSLEEAARFAPQQVVELCRELVSTREQLDQFKQQLDWFKRQLFGSKSERRLKEVSSGQLWLGDLGAGAAAGVEPQRQRVAQHTRKVGVRGADAGAEALPFFDQARVPVQTIELPAPQSEVSPAPEAHRCRHHGEPGVADPDRAAGHRAAGAALPGAAWLDPAGP